MFFRPILFTAPLLLTAAVSSQAQTTIEEITITAEFRDTPLMETSTSLTAINFEDIERRAANQLEEILNLAPNVNYSAGASRGRYLQIRGIGERSQFVDPISPSVGLIIDGVDFSTMGNAATLFDVAQVEILRGPQGTKFGSSALAGIVNIQSQAPSEHTEGFIKAGMGNYGRLELGGALSGALGSDVQGRISISQLTSDGFIENTFLGRDDTNGRDELSTKAQLNWQLNDDTSIKASYLYVDIDNGYDAFSLSNDRNTLSDQPGHDRQRSDALSLILNSSASEKFALQASASIQKTDSEYGFDEDWTNTQICDDLACDSDNFGYDWWYSSTDNYIRDFGSTEVNLRAVSEPNGAIFSNSSWVLGLNYKDTSLDLDRDFFDFVAYQESFFESTFDTNALSLYGEIDTPLSDHFSLTVGGRVEDYNSDYNDISDVSESPSETLWGGEINLTYTHDKLLAYALVSRGYKPGGINGNAIATAQRESFSVASIGFLEDRLIYETETANNLEIGSKIKFEKLDLRLAAFYVDRKDIQLNAWINEGTTFVGYTDNGATGSNSGVEIEFNYYPNERISLFGSLGLLDTKVENFRVIVDDIEIDKSGREQAHAPSYQFSIGTNLVFSELLTGRLEIEGKDSFYFSDSHDQRSTSSTLVHAQIAYQLDALKMSLWARNLTDEDYQVRGFYFENDPRDFYENAVSYTQLGDPRTFGLTASYSF